ncbi:MAG: metal ABC transporter substrate-binding protein [Clostridia bacterium]|nr:metal ABC transporter substrate-binding protein [Clostridia bacterium]
MNRILFLLLCLMLCFPTPSSAEEVPLSIIATNFPAFDFARSLAGSTADVQMLLPPGSESHSYEPTPQDIIAIQSCDLFIYTGGESDSWIESILASMGSSAPQTFRMSDQVTLLASETTTSMEHSHGHEHDELWQCSDPEHIHEEGHIHEMDEHVWTSPKNAMRITAALKDMLCLLNPVAESVYNANFAAYQAELARLDSAFEEIVASGKRDLILFGDRFPLRYFADAYHLRYDAAFPGCSEDSEPSVRTVISLVDTIRREQIPVVFYIEFSSRRTADILAEETGAKPLLFHSCHNVSAGEMQDGATYLSLMWHNTEALKEALN